MYLSRLILRFCMYEFVPIASDDAPDATHGLTITLTVGTKTIVNKVPDDILEDDPGPFTVDRIKLPFSLRRAVLKTDYDEYQLVGFFPKLPRFVVQRHSEEHGHVTANTGAPRALGGVAGGVAGGVTPSLVRLSSPFAAPGGGY